MVDVENERKRVGWQEWKESKKREETEEEKLYREMGGMVR
jgi:hypothetical protein